MAQELITQEENITTADLLRRTTDPHGPDVSKPQTDHEAILPDVETFRRRWHDIQTSFVDEPQPSVEKADELVASVIQQIAQVFADERAKLESDWRKGDEVSTEDLRQALRRYRSFFDRLLAM
jgi:hypothetical protein